MLFGYLQGRVVRPLAENHTLLILCSTTVVVMLGQGVISPVLPLYAQSFGVGTAVIGLSISLFGAARLVANLPAGFLSERYGRRLLLVGGPAITVVGSLLSGLAPDIWLLLLFRFISGAGSALYMTGAMVYLVDITTDENRGRLMSIYQGSLLLGVTLGPAIGGFVAAAFGLRSPFFLVAALAFLAMLWGMVRLPETGLRVERKPSAAEEKVSLPEPVQTRHGVILSLLRDPNFLLISLVSLSIFLTRSGGRLSLVPLVGRNRLDLDAAELGLIFALSNVVNLLVLLPAGTLADRLGRKRVIVPSLMSTAVAFVLYAVAGDPWVFVLAAVIDGAGLAGVPAAYAADIAPANLRGVSMGLYRTFGDVGFVAGPVLLGWLADAGGFGRALGLNAAVLLVVALAFGLLARETLVRAPRAAVVARASEISGTGD